MPETTPFPVDLDAEAIFVDGNWYTREDLARRIKAMLDQGDFSVARPSAALEQLTGALRNVQTLAFRAPGELAEAINQIATRSGVTVGQVLREAAMGMVMASKADRHEDRAERREDTARVPIPQPPPGHPAARTAPPYPEPRAQALAHAPAAPAQRVASPQQPVPEVRPMVTASPAAPVAVTSPAVLAGPGALRSAGVTAEEKPVELTNPKKPNEEASAEHRWFKQ